MARTRLVWKWEEGYEKGETPVGPPDRHPRRGQADEHRKGCGGEWIAREEAVRLARENHHDLLLDE
jgi:hypothetical protein